MNKHFEETRYHLKRATETATRGLKSELEPIEERFREMTGREKEPEPGRIEKVRADLGELQERAEGETREAIAEARARLSTFREQRP
jgi:hypothetical protein